MIHVANAEIGTQYRIKSLNMNNAQLKHRLRALGCIEGSKVSIHQKGLFKGPCTLNINGQQICVRNCDACNIRLEHHYE
ncbi:ferrous iron transport protein A [Staphylococcus muscae]|uniref:FeoA domain-containing protein n=1 Tax=Staphylococcus muscae TaxID=1294 RepID=A0A240BV72_9STAP|nr:FeoA family protein [Staphylococcus muscae]AVQ34233.1 ferrous iron transport protein A [Staphylococcus muscae]PNZ05784.1 ferrous iron transport protein A [Staphylococcus muscae]GGA84979.1 ferrous iron transporter A [Staphylococcus muscae]SNV99614.1 FeoA domain-containing protein [Staphylococcus muscae]